MWITGWFQSSWIELLGPLHFADLAGGLAEGSAVFGIVMAVSFAAAGVGSLLAPGASVVATRTVKDGLAKMNAALKDRVEAER